MRNEEQIKSKIIETLYSAGCDEAGAGCGASDLLVAAVILDPKNPIEGLNDSKKLTEKKREALYPEIIEKALDYCIIHVSPQEIDKINILQARMEGFRRAIEILVKRTGATYAVIDGNKKPDGLLIETDFLVKADAILPGVSCASIVAKHSHTQYIKELCKDELYKKYGFESHQGYGTKVHMEKLKEYDPIEGFHRYSYQPVKDSIKV